MLKKFHAVGTPYSDVFAWCRTIQSNRHRGFKSSSRYKRTRSADLKLLARFLPDLYFSQSYCHYQSKIFPNCLSLFSIAHTMGQ